MQKWKLLVVDDEQLVIDSIQLILPDNWSLVGANRLEDIPAGYFHAAFVDQHLKNSNEPFGLEVIRKLRKTHPMLEIVAISGDFDRKLMEKCLEAGATRFLAKPLNQNEIKLVLDKIEALHFLQKASQLIHKNLYWFGSSELANNLKKQIAMFKGEQGPILIQGESGTGKENIVHLLHQQDGERPLITVNVAAITESIFESELFGHVKGAFTGADQNKMGLAEAAHGGDLFLDEIEALSLPSQVKLLRFLETGEIRKVGSKSTSHVDVRVIAATNQNLEKLVEKGAFREDLLYRLNGKKILIPPLRERANDVIDLVQFFLKNQFAKYNKVLSEDAEEIFKSYTWPGNIRELKRTLEQACLSAPLPILRAEDIEPLVMKSFVNKANDIELAKGLDQLLSDYEVSIIKKCLSVEPDVDKAAHMLGISRSSLYKKMKDYKVEV